MYTKLTLSLEKDVIEKAKIYAKNNKVSLSKLVENHLKFLSNLQDTDISSKKLK